MRLPCSHNTVFMGGNVFDTLSSPIARPVNFFGPRFPLIEAACWTVNDLPLFLELIHFFFLTVSNTAYI